MNWTPNRRMVAIALSVFGLDQLTKYAVLQVLGPTQEHVVVDGFFKFVNWSNTGAAWSLFHNRNTMLAVVSIVALIGLFLWRHHFDTKTIPGQVSLGLIFGGILGNLTDRLLPHADQFGHKIYGVIDFLRFYLYRRSGEEIGFPAFNVADSAICVGVGLLIIISWKQETHEEQPPSQEQQSVEG